MHSIFREYDIRGIFQKELNEAMTKAIGYNLGLEVIKSRTKSDEKIFVSIGYDARTHSPQLFEWLSHGFMRAGCCVLDMGMVTTGVNYFTNFVPWEIAGESVTTSASVMITGSHNPPEYNGFKITINKQPFFGKDIEALGRAIIGSSCAISTDKTKAVAYKIDAKNAYINYLTMEFGALKNMPTRVVADCGNGVAAIVLKDILSKLNISTKWMHEEPDGTFPNHHPDPSDEHNLEDIKKELSGGAFDIGFAFDGDADRIAVLTQKYNIKGDQLALIFAHDLARKGKKPVVIGEVKCSKIMYDEINKIGSTIMYKTGHSNLKVKLKESGEDFAAEVSGHMFFNDKWFGFDDAVYVAMRVLELIYEGTNLDAQMDAQPKMYSTDEIKVYVTEETKFPIIQKIKQTLENPPSYMPQIIGIIDIDGVRVSFANGWGLVRASNTTPVLVTRFEADSVDSLDVIQTAMNRLIEEAKS